MKYLIYRQKGFTLIEVIIVILILSILGAFAIPKFADLRQTSRINTLEQIAGNMESTIAIVRSVAFTQGLTVSNSNPGDQSAYLIETEAGQFEIDWRNLCPEAVAEMGDALDMGQHLDLKEESGLSIIFNNQYYRVGYNIQGSGPITANGCYISYDSFGDPECTVDIVTTDC